MHLLLAYIKFLFRSTNEHGVHSPFVFSLVTKCFYDKKKYPAYEQIKKYRKRLLSNHNTIKVTDFGAGSRVFSSEMRKISAIAKNAGLSPKRARLLNRLVRYLEAEQALELGTSLGIGTAALAAGNKVKVTTIEGCPETAAVARKQFEKFGFDNIELVVGEFDEILVESDQRTEDRGQRTEDRGQRTEDRGKYEGRSTKLEVGTEGNSEEKNPKFQIPNSKNLKPKTDEKQQTTNNKQQTTSPTTDEKQQTINHKPQTTSPTTHNSKNSKSQIPNPNNKPQTTNHKQTTTYDLIFIDGNHQKSPTLSYFHHLLPLVHNDSVMIFDDIHWSKEMEEAWEEIKKHPSVKVTIDTFYQGFVFFRREQAKEHFVIRI